MITRNLKAFFYFAFSWLMAVNGARYRKWKAPKTDITSVAPRADGAKSAIKVQLGPGKRNYLDGWINLDSNCFTAKIDVWVNLEFSLPLNDSSIDALYSHHVIEHLPDLRFHFAEAFRVLKPGGVYRVGGPHGDNSIKKFLEGDLAWFPTFPDSYRSIGGRFQNYIFCRREHLTILTFSYLEEIMTDAGFVDLRGCMPTRESNYPEFFDAAVLKLEFESDFQTPHTLIIEARKPV